MLAAINAVAAEFSNTRRRHLSVSLMSIGYPVGAVVGGSVAAGLLQGNDWRSVFYFGAGVTAALIPVVFFLMPESVHWLARKQPAGALEKINAVAAQDGTRRRRRAAVVPPRRALAAPAADIFAPGLMATTVTITLAYFFHITTFYFILKWMPKIVVDMGFAASSAAGVLVWTNVGGATGGAVLGLLTQRYKLIPLTVGTLLLSSVMVTLFGRSPADLQQLSFYSFWAGFCINAGIVGLYAIIAQAFPTHVRASGTGLRHRRRARRFGDCPDHRGLPVHRGLQPAHDGAGLVGWLAPGSRHAAPVAIGYRQRGRGSQAWSAGCRPRAAPERTTRAHRFIRSAAPQLP